MLINVDQESMLENTGKFVRETAARNKSCCLVPLDIFKGRKKLSY